MIAKGTVQGVGFRYIVRHMAYPLGIKGYVKDLNDGTMEIVAEGTRPNIDSMIQSVRNLEESTKIDEVLVSYGRATGEFKAFVIVPGSPAYEVMEGFASCYPYYALTDKKLLQST